MIYKIQGKQLPYDGGECGLYKSRNPIERMEYAVMDINLLVTAINGMPLQKAVEAVTQLKDQATEQAKWQHTPQNAGFPILRQLPSSDISITKVRGNIQNTEKFCNDVLNALGGK